MENSVKAIIIAASVAITMIIVSIGFFILRQGQGIAIESSESMSEMSESMADADKTIYDGNEVNGSEVTVALRKYKEKYIGIYVKTGKNGGEWYIKNVSESSGVGEITSDSSNDISDTYDETSDEYINTSGKFKSEIVRDANGSIVAIKFTQK